MKKIIVTCVVVTMILAMSGLAGAAIDVNIYGAAAPNVYGGSSYSPWWSNAQGAIRGGLTNQGSGNSEYIQLSGTGGVSADQPGYQAIVSGFDSWHGVAGGTGEYGTRVHFIYDIKATAGESLSLANISGLDILEDGWGDTNYSLFNSASFDSSTAFDALKRVGYKADGTAVTSGNDMTGITEIIGTFGMAYAVYYGAGQWYYQTGDTMQDTLNRGIADMDQNLQNWTGTLTYGDIAVDTTVTFVPEPATMLLLGLGAVLLRKKK